MIKLIIKHFIFTLVLLCFITIAQIVSADNLKGTNTPSTSINSIITPVINNGVDRFPQVRFWQNLMNTSPDTFLINISSNRQIIDTFSRLSWKSLSQKERSSIIKNYKQEYCVTNHEHIYITSGKNHFYNYKNIDSIIHLGISIFEKEHTDPFYALTILLIESPTHAKRSQSGAHGHFQLMKAVARQMGLKVTSTIDERKNFKKCAIGAAKLIRTICIPETNKMLEKHNISYNTSSLWYKLLVLHTYHAGAYNVEKALGFIANKQPNFSIITNLWQTNVGRFKNQSQNYTQIALAALLEYNKTLEKNNHEQDTY